MERIEHDNVELLYQRGSLKIIFGGTLIFDESLKDEHCSGWQFEGCKFKMTLYSNVALEFTKSEKPNLRWSYPIRHGDTTNSIFPNILSGMRQ